MLQLHILKRFIWVYFVLTRFVIIFIFFCISLMLPSEIRSFNVIVVAVEQNNLKMFNNIKRTVGTEELF